MHTLSLFQSPHTYFSYHFGTAYNVTWRVDVQCTDGAQSYCENRIAQRYSKLLSTAYRYTCTHTDVLDLLENFNFSSQRCHRSRCWACNFFWECVQARETLLSCAAYAQNEHFTILRWSERYRGRRRQHVKCISIHSHYANEALYTLQNVHLNHTVRGVCVCGSVFASVDIHII